MNAWCTQCGDEFTPIEGNAAPIDPDEPRFCSEQCAEAFSDCLAAYEEAAPVA